MGARSNLRERAARLRPSSFVPSVTEISPEDIGGIYGLEAVVNHWTGGECHAEEWIGLVREEYGGAGFYASRGEVVLGFLIHAPASMLPRAFEFPVGPIDERSMLLAYLEGDPRTSKRLMVRMLRTMKERGVSRVESVASDAGASRHVRTEMLLDNGWRSVRRGWHLGRPYTLADIELGNTVETGEFARSIIGHVRFPELRAPVPGVVSPARVSESSSLISEER